jgi:hypothetical protein
MSQAETEDVVQRHCLSKGGDEDGTALSPLGLDYNPPILEPRFDL